MQTGHVHAAKSQHPVTGLTSPYLYSCSPHAPTAFMTEALWMTVTWMPSCCARSCRSLCVVALQGMV